MTWPRYPSYRPSGIDWIGDIPDHWTVRRLPQLARLESGHTPSRSIPAYWKNCTIPWVTLSDTHQFRDTYAREIHETAEKISEIGMRNSAARLLPADTVILSRTASVGYAVKLGRPMATTQDFANWVCGAELDPDFLLSCLWVMSGEFERLRYGSTHNTIYMPDIRSLMVPHPPLDEQARIALFLEQRLATINALIEKKRRLIELLEEKRQTVISRAVTKGLDPNAPMKPSGIDWLGDIPAHWEVLPLTRVVRMFVDYRGSTPTKLDSGIPLITATQIKNGRIDHTLDPVFISEEEYNLRMTRGLPEKGDVLITTEAPLGETAQIEDERVAPGQRIILLKPEPRKITKDYLHLHFRSDVGRSELLSRASGSTAAGIRADRLRASLVLVPPMEEQQTITQHVIPATNRHPSIQAQIFDHIQLLEEHRTSLIAAAVSGKIDVRDTVAASDAVDKRLEAAS